MIALETLQYATFADLIGHEFNVTSEGFSVKMKLKEAKLAGHKRTEAMRDPFSLTFAAEPGLRVTQGIYRFECPELGEMELFMTQIMGNPTETLFETIFT